MAARLECPWDIYNNIDHSYNTIVWSFMLGRQALTDWFCVCRMKDVP